MKPSASSALVRLWIFAVAPVALATEPGGTAIPFSGIGAKATADYKGDALAITPTADGAHLRAGFQKLEAEATPEGLWISSVSDKSGRFKLVSSAVGRDLMPRAALPPRGDVLATKDLVTFARPGVEEEYSVSVDGVRQDFIIPERPAGAGALVVDLAVSGAKAEAANTGARLILEASGRVLAYSRLKATDGTGKELTAMMSVTSAHTLRIRVEDAAAVYPVRIDPTFSDANWVGTTTGAVPGVHNGSSPSVAAVAILGTDIYVGGSFSYAGAVPANNIARWTGTAWVPLGSSTQNGTGVATTVTAIAALSSTEVYVGGSFTTVADSSSTSISASRIARWNPSTGLWSRLGTSTQNGAGNTVRAIAALSSSEIYAGGDFTTVADSTSASIAANRVAKWNGSAWLPLGTSTQNGAGNTVRAIAALSSSEVYVGGDFVTTADSTSSSIAANRVAKWNGSAWSPLGTSTQNGAGNTVRAIAARSSSEIYAGGDFTTVADSTSASIAANRVAKWNGSAWSTLGTSTQNGAGATVNAIAVLSSTEIYIGGAFTTVADSTSASISANRIAKWNGSAWSWLGSATQNGTSNTVNAIAALSSSAVAVGGIFVTAADSTSSPVMLSGIGIWNGTSNTWSAAAYGSGFNGTVYAVAVAGTDVYAGGNFSFAGGTYARGIARWNGTAWSPLGTAIQNGTGSVFALAALSPSVIYVGGSFTSVADSTGSSISANRVAKWDSSTNTWSPLGTSTQNGANNAVRALSALSATEIYVGGQFTTVSDSTGSGMSARNVARWDSTTSRWFPLGTSAQNGTGSTVDAIAAVSTTEVYVGGGPFTTVADSTSASISANNIAKWNGSTSTWSPLGTAAQNGTNSVVYAIAWLSSTELYVGGGFSAVADSTSASINASNIAKWNGTTGTWSRLGTASQNGVNGSVFSIVTASSSRVYVGGFFTTMSDSSGSAIAANRIALWDGTASRWSAFGGGLSGGVRALAADSSNHLFLGGDFTSAGASPVTTASSWVQANLAPFIVVEQPAGTGLASGVSSVSFGGVLLGASSAALTFTVKNNGYTSLSLATPTLSGTNPGDFSVNTTGMASSVASGGQTTFSVTFSPTFGGARTATLNIPSSDTSSPFTITLTGTGISFSAVEQPSGTGLTSGVSSVNCGASPAGMSATATVFTVKNTGTIGQTLTINTPTLSGSNAADYSVNTSGMATSLSNGQSTTFSVTFTASTGNGITGSRSATLTITDSDPANSPFTVALSGTALSYTTDTDGDGMNDAAEFLYSALGFEWQTSQPALVTTYITNANAANLYSQTQYNNNRTAGQNDVTSSPATYNLFTQTQYNANRTAGQNDVINSPNTYNLFTTSQIQASNAGVPLLQRDNSGIFTLTLGVLKSIDLIHFNAFPITAPQTSVDGQGRVQVQFTVPDNAAFFKVQAQ